MTPRARDESGFVAGWEVMPFGLLIFAVGTLLLVNVWAVVDMRLALGDAAREGARTFVHADREDLAVRDAHRAVTDTLTARGKDPDRVLVDPIRATPGFVRCAQVTVHLHTTVPAFVLPFVGGFGHGFAVEGTHREMIDPFRSGLSAESACRG